MTNAITLTFAELRAAAKNFDPQLDDFFSADESLTYEVRWPTAHSTPPGILIYVSPKPGASVPPMWETVLDQNNLVWVGAHNSGNEVHVARRVGMALLAATLAEQAGSINQHNVILSGFSGGGRVASMMLPAYPDNYSGALYICGANPLSATTQESLDSLRKLPMIFLTGSNDFNLEDTRMAIASYQQAGLLNAHLMVIDGLEHALPDAEGLARAISFMQPT